MATDDKYYHFWKVATALSVAAFLGIALGVIHYLHSILDVLMQILEVLNK